MANPQAIQNHASFIWSVADLLRGLQHLANIISASMGAAAATNVRPTIHHVDGADLCRIQVNRRGFPVDAVVTHDKNGQHVKQTQFFVRVANGTKVLDDEGKQKYVTQHWPAGT